jgi:hypothetical protein
MEEFVDGKYALYSGNDILGELTIKDGSISYDNEADEHSIGDIFPKGKINLHTKGQLNKYLHGHHAYLHLQLEDSSEK